jgi:hypothetical protein
MIAELFGQPGWLIVLLGVVIIAVGIALGKRL